MKIGFVFTNFNSSKYSLELISSLRKHDNFDNYIIVIVDNNSENSEKIILEELNSYMNVKLLYNDKNVGYFQGLNIGI
jgi:GT2 family glycosyltransferase